MASEFKRVPTPAGLRRTILLRDNLTCQYCATTTADAYEVDHIVPVALGGPTVAYNLVTACETCNQKKRDTTWIPLNIETLEETHPQWAAKIYREGYHPSLVITVPASTNVQMNYGFQLRALAIEFKCDPLDMVTIAFWRLLCAYGADGGDAQITEWLQRLNARRPLSEPEPEPDYEDALQAYAA